MELWPRMGMTGALQFENFQDFSDFSIQNEENEKVLEDVRWYKTESKFAKRTVSEQDIIDKARSEVAFGETYMQFGIRMQCALF